MFNDFLHSDFKHTDKLLKLSTVIVIIVMSYGSNRKQWS